MPPKTDDIRARLDAVIAAMKEQGVWDVERPADAAFADMGPFGMHTMAFEQWLRWVFVPSIEERLAGGGPWPSSSSVAVQATREGDGNPRVAVLADSLRAFDALFNQEHAPPALRALTPPPRAKEPYDRSRAAFERGDHRAALAAISEALLLDRAYPNAHNFAGWILFHWPSRTSAQLDDAIAHFHEAIKVDPEDGVPLVNLCDALLAAGRPQDAIAEAEAASHASVFSARSAFALNWLGWYALQRPETLEDAVKHFRAAVTRRWQWGVARTNLGKALEMTHHPDEAYEELGRALECGDSFDPAFCHERRSAYEARHGWFRTALVSMRNAFGNDQKRGGGRAVPYGEALTWLEQQLRSNGIEPPAPGKTNVAWEQACAYEIPPGMFDRGEDGKPLPEAAIEIERLLRAERWTDAIKALEAQPSVLVDALGYASLGVTRALRAGEREAAIALQLLVVKGYAMYASGATSGGEGMSRMADVERARARLREIERG